MDMPWDGEYLNTGSRKFCTFKSCHSKFVIILDRTVHFKKLQTTMAISLHTGTHISVTVFYNSGKLSYAASLEMILETVLVAHPISVPKCSKNTVNALVRMKTRWTLFPKQNQPQNQQHT